MKLNSSEMRVTVSGIEGLVLGGAELDLDDMDVMQAHIATYRDTLHREPTTPAEAAFQAIMKSYGDPDRVAGKHPREYDMGLHQFFWLPLDIREQVIDALRYAADHADHDPLASIIPDFVERERMIAATAIGHIEKFTEQS